MGAAASIPSDTQVKAKQYIANVNNGTTLADSLKSLWDLGKIEEYKLAMCDPSLGLFPALNKLFINHRNDKEALKNAIGCICDMTTSKSPRRFVASKDGIVVQLLRLVEDSRDRRETIIDNNTRLWIFYTIANCCIECASHAYLLTDPEVRYLEIMKAEMLQYPDFPNGFKCIACLLLQLTREHADFIAMSGIPAIFVNRLVQFGSIPSAWTDRYSGIAYWILNGLTAYSGLPGGRKALISLHQTDFFAKMLSVNEIEGIRSSIIVSNLAGSNEGSNLNGSLLEQYPSLYKTLLQLYRVTLDYNAENAECKDLNGRGFAYGIIKMRDITAVLKNLSVSEKNKAILLSDPSLIPLMVRTTNLFIFDSPELNFKFNLYIEYGGGGGKDYETIDNLLETFSQLSFYYENDNAFQSAFLKSEYSMRSMLESLIALSPERNLPYEAKMNASTLLNRLIGKEQKVFSVPTPTMVISSNPSGNGGEARSDVHTNNVEDVVGSNQPMHIMLSYSWAANKNLVVKFGKRLQALGYDVWRDEVGSSLVGPMSGDIVESMAAAIQSSYMMIICVSPEYKESANCRQEAKYARARSLSANLQIAYVMMYEDYHTRSTPRVVDGWLGFMIGSELWYPLWNDGCIDTTAQAMTELLKGNAMLSRNKQLVNSIPSPGKPKVNSHFFLFIVS
jgi:hypothetical protein